MPDTERQRLNTDLIKRLSHAFGCEPAELLQETSHENKLITPIEFSRRRRSEAGRESSMPLYCVAANENDSSKLEIKICSPAEWKYRPIELHIIEIIAKKLEVTPAMLLSVVVDEIKNNNIGQAEGIAILDNFVKHYIAIGL